MSEPNNHEPAASDPTRQRTEQVSNSDHPVLAAYLLVLPEPLPITHGSTWTQQLDEREPLLDGVEIRPVGYGRLTQPSVALAEGYNSVSLRFWQVLDDEQDVPEYLYRARLAARVAEALNPESIHRDDQLVDAGPTDNQSYRTVVEATTFVARTIDYFGTETKPDPLSRCITVLTKFHRAYRVATRTHVPELSYERLHAGVLWLTKPAFDTSAPFMPAGVMMLETGNLGPLPTELLDDASIRVIAQYVARSAVGDPFGLYVERRLEAEMEIWTNGRPREGVLQCGIAAEVLLDGLLGLAMWEESVGGTLTLDQAAGVLSSDLTRRIRSQYEKRFGGRWSFDHDPIRRWSTEIADPRNRVVHAGVEPDKIQATAAVAALISLERYVGDRLAAKSRRFPRTAWMFLGTEGFHRRSKTKLAAIERWVSEDGSSITTWLRDYQQWREQVDPLINRRRRG